MRSCALFFLRCLVALHVQGIEINWCKLQRREAGLEEQTIDSFTGVRKQDVGAVSAQHGAALGLRKIQYGKNTGLLHFH